MRTKALLGLAALAAMITTAAAQNVYSVNVVGYVNVTLEAGKLHFLSLPLAPTDGNYDIGNMIKPDSGDGSQDFTSLIWWNQSANAWDNSNPLWLGGAWDTTLSISNGVGFFLVPNANGVMTFVGEVPQGTIPYSTPAGLHTLANKVPVSANWPGADIGGDFDTIITWNQSNQAWDNAQWLYLSGAWDNGGNPGNDVNGPLLNPANAVFYVNEQGATFNFSRNFTVQ
jgi:hypothetical protein